MRYSVYTRDRIHVKGYGLPSFTVGKNLSGNYSRKLFDHAKKSTTSALKTVSKSAIQKVQRKLVNYKKSFTRCPI